MIYGNEGSGKTTLSLLIVASAQRKHPDMEAVWVDPEKKYDPVWAERLGVDSDRIRVVRPSTGEQAVDIIEAAMRVSNVSIVGLDSIASLLPYKILEKSAEDLTVGERARLVGLLCSKVQQAWIDEQVRDHYPTFLAINQFRERVGVMFGDTRTLPGGRFKDYMVDSKLELKKQEVMNKDEESGFQVHIENKHPFLFTKTKGGFSLKSGETVMVMDDSVREDGLRTGQFDDYVTVCTYAKRAGYITGGGTSWKIVTVEDMVFRKRDDMVDWLKANPAEFIKLKQLLIMRQRRVSCLPPVPVDNYLLEPMGRKRIAELTEAVMSSEEKEETEEGVEGAA